MTFKLVKFSRSTIDGNSDPRVATNDSIPAGLGSWPILTNIFVSDFAKVLEAIFITLALHL